MRNLQFRAAGLEPEQEQELRRLEQRPPAAPRWLIVAGGIAALAYTANHPGELRIASTVTTDTTAERFIDVSGVVGNPRVETVSIDVNGSPRSATVTGDSFTTRVPLVPGDNVIYASAGGLVSLFTPRSNVLRVYADITPPDIWSELTWDGPGDLDLHLSLPDGGRVYFERQSASGAVLDVDNRIAYGPEHITMQTAIPGPYELWVHYYSQADTTQPAPPVQWTVTLRLRGGQTSHTYTGTLRSRDEATQVWTTDWKPE